MVAWIAPFSSPGLYSQSFLKTDLYVSRAKTYLFLFLLYYFLKQFSFYCNSLVFVFLICIPPHNFSYMDGATSQATLRSKSVFDLVFIYFVNPFTAKYFLNTILFPNFSMSVIFVFITLRLFNSI